MLNESLSVQFGSVTVANYTNVTWFICYPHRLTWLVHHGLIILSDLHFSEPTISTSQIKCTSAYNTFIIMTTKQLPPVPICV